MKKLILILTTITSFTAKAQTSVYQMFPEDSATWITDIYYNTCFGYCGTIFYEMKGDTIINSQSYNKIYWRDGHFYYVTAPPNSIVGANFTGCSYIGAVRQDSINKKVYFIDSTMTTDTLLYDFDLAVGDTIQSWYNKSYMQWPLIVSEIDSIIINGTYHKRFDFQNNLNNQSLVEGVGWTGELFGISQSALFTALACFEGNVIIQEAFVNECAVSLDCSIALDVNEPEEKQKFSLFPNPFSDKLNFAVNNSAPSEIIIYDIVSRKIVQQKFTNSITLHTEQLENGIYIYEVRNNSGFIQKGKVVKK